jgi:hypothetical protein
MTDAFQVVVADDVCRFALYVWRYLSRSIGFGTSDVANDPSDDEVFRNGKAPRSLTTAAKDADVWWINIKKDWNQELDRLFEKLEEIGAGGRRLFLVDVRGPYGSGSARELVKRLASRGVKVSEDENESEVLLVSSYTVAPQTIELDGRSEPVHLGVRPKSPETLEWISHRIRLGVRKHSRKKAGFSQVLVTGAGFELHDRSLRCRRLGMRFTADILEKALNADFKRDASCKGFFLPENHARKRPLRTAACNKDLDRYWNEFLLLELARVARKESAGRRQPRPTVGEVKLRASRHEYRLREAFRQQFVADDWGFLGQALDVLEMEESLGLVAWLTTNYTRFADRAIDLWTLHRGKGGQDPMWRTVSTGSEAERLLRELLHGAQRTGGCGDRCILFKLHGDLAHLLTMAIAGHDKDISSPLSLPISSLHSVYVAADLYLKQRLASERKVLWHIVGHGLKDNLLVEVLANVHRENPKRHWFVVVDPVSNDGTKILTRRLPNARVFRAGLNADDYMARIVRNPLTSLSRLEAWIRDLGTSAS